MKAANLVVKGVYGSVCWDGFYLGGLVSVLCSASLERSRVQLTYSEVARHEMLNEMEFETTLRVP